MASSGSGREMHSLEQMPYTKALVAAILTRRHLPLGQTLSSLWSPASCPLERPAGAGRC